MRAFQFRVRTLIAASGFAAVLLWAAMTASRSYDYYRRARDYESQSYGWSRIAVQGSFRQDFSVECAEYFARLADKYRRAAWRPWLAVTPDPYAPGVQAYLDQQRRSRAGGAPADLAD